MLQCLMRYTGRSGIRPLSNSAIVFDSKQPVTESSGQATAGSTSSGSYGTLMHKCTNFDKRVLSWMNRYPSFAEVPDKVTIECITQARSKFRIRLCNYMIVASVIGCIAAIYTGKFKGARGENLTQYNLDWHEKINREYQSSVLKDAASKEASAEKGKS
ncbi:UPF0389 protein CG9231 [Orussus abietinus]|uniref:UPF0389 protein CG9231 n=1 Tax=Orussus abietinus TaxID=222816 RepID=UPI000625BBC0|nr:UPF0389 protein CG9231 [Orussus abietinus]